MDDNNESILNRISQRPSSYETCIQGLQELIGGVYTRRQLPTESQRHLEALVKSFLLCPLTILSRCQRRRTSSLLEKTTVGTDDREWHVIGNLRASLDYPVSLVGGHYTVLEHAFDEAYITCLASTETHATENNEFSTPEWVVQVMLPIAERVLSRARKYANLQVIANKLLAKIICTALANDWVKSDPNNYSDANEPCDGQLFDYMIRQLSVIIARVSRRGVNGGGFRIGKAVLRLLTAWKVNVLFALQQQERDFNDISWRMQYLRLKKGIEWIIFNVIGYIPELSDFFVDSCISKAKYYANHQESLEVEHDQNRMHTLDSLATLYKIVIEGLFIHFGPLFSNTMKEGSLFRVRQLHINEKALEDTQNLSDSSSCQQLFCDVSNGSKSVGPRGRTTSQTAVVPSTNISQNTVSPWRFSKEKEYNEIFQTMMKQWKKLRLNCSGTNDTACTTHRSPMKRGRETSKKSNSTSTGKRIKVSLEVGSDRPPILQAVYRVSAHEWGHVLDFLGPQSAMRLRRTCSTIKWKIDQCFQWYLWFIARWGDRLYYVLEPYRFTDLFHPYLARASAEKTLRTRNEQTSSGYTGPRRKKSSGKMCPVFGCNEVRDDESSVSRHTKEHHGRNYRTLLQNIRQRRSAIPRLLN